MFQSAKSSVLKLIFEAVSFYIMMNCHLFLRKLYSNVICIWFVGRDKGKV